jgi:hypothetical protein
MQYSGSKPHRLRATIIVAAFAAVLGAVAWTLMHGAGEHSSPLSATATTTGASVIPEGPPGDAKRAITSQPTTQLKRLATAQALPPPSSPLAQTYAELKARADAGDVAAAGRLFQDAHRCFRARMTTLVTPRVARAYLREDTSKLTAEQLKAHEENLAMIEKQIEEARAESAGCEGLSDAQLQLAPLALQAAKLGDTEATRCYVSGFFLYAGGLFDHPEWLAEYRSSALALAQAAIERGDWAMVGQLSDSYSGWPIAPLSQVLSVGPAQSYRYLKLQRLGATEATAARLEDELATTTRDMSAEQIAEGDAWAQEAYLRYFGGQPATSDLRGLALCPI